MASIGGLSAIASTSARPSSSCCSVCPLVPSYGLLEGGLRSDSCRSTYCGVTTASGRVPLTHASESVHSFGGSRRGSRSRRMKLSASFEEGVKSSETGSGEESRPPNPSPLKSESPSPSTSNPFASGKISSRIVAKQAGVAKEPNQEAATLVKPARKVKSEEAPKGQLSASVASQLKVTRPPSVFTVPTKSGGGKPVSPFTKPAGDPKPSNPVNPFIKAPMVPTDWEKAGARPAGSGKRVLEAFKQGEKQGNTTKFGQPLVPTNIFDDVRRTPEEIAADAFKFEINSGQLLLVGSFLLIILLMVGTAFLVWKVGAIHYNEY